MSRIAKGEPSSSDHGANRRNTGESDDNVNNDGNDQNDGGLERRVLRSRYLAVKNLISVQKPREQVADAEALLDIANTLMTSVKTLTNEVEDFLVHDVKFMVASAEKLSNSDKLKQGVNQLLSILETCHQPWMNGLALLEDREQKKHYLSTACESFDVLLQGGLREGHVTELVGPSSSGKTQVCFQVASNVAMKLGSVIFFDSGNSLSPTRMKQIVTCISCSAENQGDKILQQTLRNIQCHAVFDIYALLNILHQLKLNLKSQTGYQVRLIIVDSISSLIAPILGGRNSQGHALMVSVGYLLKELADTHNIAVVVTNHMVSGEGGNLKPALGESWKSIPHVRLQLSRDHTNNIYGVHILRHPYIASGTGANFMIP